MTKSIDQYWNALREDLKETGMSEGQLKFAKEIFDLGVDIAMKVLREEALNSPIVKEFVKFRSGKN